MSIGSNSAVTIQALVSNHDTENVAIVATPHLSSFNKSKQSSKAMLDDDMIPDSRVYNRPAQVVETKLSARLRVGKRG